MHNRKKNALAKLGHALSGYLKTASADKGNRQKQPVSQSKHKPVRRHQEYAERCGIQSINRVRSCIVQPDGTTVTVDVFNHHSAHARRWYIRR